MAVEQLTPQMGAKWQNELLEHGVKVFEDTVRMGLRNAMQDGYLMLTTPLKPKDEAAYLVSPKAQQQSVTMLQDMDADVRAKGMALWNRIQEALNGSEVQLEGGG